MTTGDKPHRLSKAIAETGSWQSHFDAMDNLYVLSGLAEGMPETPREEPTPVQRAADIGKLIRAYRKARGFSQQDFADLSGVGRRFLSELENGKATLEFDKVVQVAASAGIDLFAKPR